MIRKINMTKEIEVKKSIVCDLCGKEYFYDKDWHDDLEIQEFISIHTIGGYSSIFGDDEPIDVDMCQHCFKKYVWDNIRKEESHG
jgi:redox-regulated HSP33 family molecular chaperone